MPGQQLAFECKYFIDFGDAEQEKKLLETPAKRKVTPSGLVGGYQIFRGTFCLH